MRVKRKSITISLFLTIFFISLDVCVNMNVFRLNWYYLSGKEITIQWVLFSHTLWMNRKKLYYSKNAIKWKRRKCFHFVPTNFLPCCNNLFSIPKQYRQEKISFFFIFFHSFLFIFVFLGHTQAHTTHSTLRNRISLNGRKRKWIGRQIGFSINKQIIRKKENMQQ